jgi:hypothetical protein
MQILTLRRRGCQTIYSIPRAIKPPLLQRELPHIFGTSYPCIITSVLFLISPWYILHYKCCGQIVKNIDQKCLQSKIILPNNEKIGILLNDKLTKKGKWIIGQKGKLPENMRSSPQPQPTSSVQVAYCSGDPSGEIKLASDYPGAFNAIGWQAKCTPMKAAGLRAPRYLEWVNLNRKFPVSFRLCGEPRCSDPTTEAQRNKRPYSLP